jgi:hypothetical protein
MDYESKYIKYKSKYQNLLNQFGGAETIIPTKLPKTYSFLFMPLIYFAVDKTSVQMIAGFENAINDCITNTKNMLGDDLIPFDNFNDFIIYLGFVLNSNGIKSLDDIKPLDGDHHIPAIKQEIITNYRSDEAINLIISCLANMLVERYAGKKFIYLK